MLKLFRKIRYDLMEKNKAGKYFKYAIGEIVLVVVGILIALQINNSNEANKSKKFEYKMLREIRKDLIMDSFYLNAVQIRPKMVENAADRFIRMKRENFIIKDSVGTLFEALGMNFNFSYRKGAYESLKSVGLDKISNDSLRSHIAGMYDFSFPRTQNLIAPHEQVSNTHYIKVFDKFFVIDFNSSKKRESTPGLTIDPLLLFNEPLFLNTVNYRKVYATKSIKRLESITRDISNLIKSIDFELNIADPENNNLK